MRTLSLSLPTAARSSSKVVACALPSSECLSPHDRILLGFIGIMEKKMETTFKVKGLGIEYEL